MSFSSIYDLHTDVNQIPSMNEKVSRTEYQQHPPTRDAVNGNFANGAIHFRFQTSGQKWWIPHRSYLRMRCRLVKGDGTTPVTLSDDVAPNMNLMPNLFQSMEMRINDKVVSRVADFVPQVDSIEKRMYKSKSWLDSVGDATNFWEKDYKKRQADATTDGLAYALTTVDSIQTPVFDRAAMGFDAATGAGAGVNNQFAYTEATGILTYTQGTNGNGLADGATAYAKGDYFIFTAIQGAVLNDPRLNKPALILDVQPGQLTVQTGVIGNDVAGDGRTEFGKIVKEASGGNVARRAGEFELTWTPSCLSLFKINHALPSGRYELVLNPQTETTYQKRAIQSLLGDKQPGAGQDYQFRVVDFYLYCATVEGPRADDLTYLLDLTQTRCQSEKIDNASFQQKNFDVSPSTYALTVAYQDLRAGQDTRVSSSIFKSYNAALSNVANVVGNVSEELKLNRLFINYAGQNLPAPDADPEFKGGTDYTIQRYTETQVYTGAMFDTGGAETIADWHDRGSYYHFAWPRDGTDRSTRVNVHQQFNSSALPAGADVANLRCLLFDHSRQIARVRIQEGRVVDVQVEDA